MDSKSVFVNCPFDNEYFKLLKPLLFTLIYIGLKPRISETSDSGEVRLHKIKEMMEDSKFSIHDLSRMEPLTEDKLPRFNVPFECGIDFGIKLSNPQKYQNKKFLILEKEQYRYQRVISDISGNDIKAHKNNPENIIKVVRDWFKPTNNDIPRHKEMWLAFNEFEFDYEDILKEEGYNPKDIYELTFSDVIEYMTNWITSFKKQ
ncbi:hypothetical protein [Flagellimonas marinaquae]|uniref:hypothetical protein n=1 Tax=Flagellimonas marinaquae TaxID=254955 RepID=UPI0020751176|nr:hypothetical protein [Allomuricauda aquimarina]USD24641.1 hypothetical protein MJO53_13255 [Allomuricauda aquimarina]